ncbi:Mu transposase C-terminal domain-containing protein [Brevibacillus porteri]|uniref:Mu transposase C-terminal domain-containing protein n=1 Tax=Brevibacillus porteri TaxID=2126350 RepID=UPI00362B4CFC
MTTVVVNSIIAWLDGDSKITSIERVLWVSPDMTDIVVINIGNMSHLPKFKDFDQVIDALENGMAKKLKVDPYAKFISHNEVFIKKHQKLRDEAWGIISNIVEEEPDIYDSRRRGELITEVCKATGQHKRAVYRQLKRYWIRGKVMNALLPEFDNCGSPGQERQAKKGVKLGRPRKVAREDPNLVGVNVTSRDKKMIRIALKAYYTTDHKNSMTFTYQKMLEEQYNIGILFKNGQPVPILPDSESVISYVQFRYWAHKELSDQKDTMIKRNGLRKYALTQRPLLGNATRRARGPGAVFEIDATVANVYLVSMFDRNRIIGRPIVYIVKDVFSRMVAGVYVGLEGPSWLGAMLALENATANKVEFCSRYGITITGSDWPCHYLPKSITADRGEMESINADHLVASLGIRVDNTPPYRADLKGIVEQHFEILDRKIGPFVPGAIRVEFRERGEPDYRLGARLTIEAFTKIIILSILEHNQKELSDYPFDSEMTTDHVPPIPLELWNWGILNCSGYLHEKPKDIVRLNLMPRSEASVTRQGIYFKKMHYSCDEALLEGWYERAVNGRFRVPVSYDPRNANFIYIPKDNGTQFIKCRLLDHYDRFQDKRFEEVEDQLYYEEVESYRRRTSQKQITASANAQIEAIIAKEIELTDGALKPSQSKASRVKNIKQNRKLEREEIRELEGWELVGKVDANKAVRDVSMEIKLGSLDDRQSNPQLAEKTMMELLKKQREERRNK